MYEIGISVAFILWCVYLVHLLVVINSQMQRNLNKIGLRISWLTLQPKPMRGPNGAGRIGSKLLKFSALALFNLPFILASWLYVAWVVGQFAYVYFKDSGAPQTVKEYRWKLRNTDMTFDQLVKETMKIGDVDPDLFEKTREEFVHDMNDRDLPVGHLIR